MLTQCAVGGHANGFLERNAAKLAAFLPTTLSKSEVVKSPHPLSYAAPYSAKPSANHGGTPASTSALRAPSCGTGT